MDTKKILLIGNGFDLAHFLPTKYEHFIESMKVIESIDEDRDIGFDELFKVYFACSSSRNNDDYFLSKTKEIFETDGIRLSIEEMARLRSRLRDNGWFQYFKYHLTDIETWIDFENEIENTLIALNHLFKMDFKHETITSSYRSGSAEHDYLINLVYKEVSSDDERIFNPSILQSQGLKSQYLVNLLGIFNITYPVYASYDNKLDKFGRNIPFNIKRIYSEEYEALSNNNRYLPSIVNIKNLNHISGVYTSFKEYEIFKSILDDLEAFSAIFTDYILLIINKLEPRKSFKIFEDLNSEITRVYTFNYSNSFERFYNKCLNEQLNRVEVQYIHGSAEKNNIVLGISDLSSDDLKNNKIYGFVKTFQKLIKNTDYMFLDDNNFKRGDAYVTKNSEFAEDYEIIIWGHSLDSSDAEYIEDIFALKSNVHSYVDNFKLKVWYHNSPHSSLSNLMHIMGKDIIQTWMKNKWLSLEKAPDIYEINNKN